MGWVRIVESQHRCCLPEPAEVGSVWECDDCGSQYRVTMVGRGLFSHRDLVPVDGKPLVPPMGPAGSSTAYRRGWW